MRYRVANLSALARRGRAGDPAQPRPRSSVSCRAILRDLGGHPAVPRRSKERPSSMARSTSRSSSRARSIGHDSDVSPAPLPEPPPASVRAPELPPVILGAGPAGLFCAHALLARGVRTIVIDRGKLVEPRRRDVARLMRSGELDPESNMNFGEGGAGAYTDGKLGTRIHHPAVRKVVELFAHYGGRVADPGRRKAARRLRRASGDGLRDAAGAGERRLRVPLERARPRPRGSGGASPRRSCSPTVAPSPATAWCSRRATAPVSSSSCSRRGAGPSRRSRSRWGSAPSTRRRSSIASSTARPRVTPSSLRPTTSSPTTRGSTAQRARRLLLLHVPRRRGGPHADGAGPAVHERDVELDAELAARERRPRGGGLAVRLRGRGLHRCRSPGSPGSASGRRARTSSAAADTARPPSASPTSWLRAWGPAPGRSSYRPGIVHADLELLFPSQIRTALREGLRGFERRMRGYVTDEAVLIGIESRTSSPCRLVRGPDQQSPSHPGRLSRRGGRRLRGRDCLLGGGRPAGRRGDLRRAGTSMTARASMRYVVRNRAGEELVCPSLADLHGLYAQGFLGDQDLVLVSPRWSTGRSQARQDMLKPAAAAVTTAPQATTAATTPRRLPRRNCRATDCCGHPKMGIGAVRPQAARDPDPRLGLWPDRRHRRVWRVPEERRAAGGEADQRQRLPGQQQAGGGDREQHRHE